MKPPTRPTIIPLRSQSELSPNTSENQPMKKQPTMLTTNVLHGNVAWVEISWSVP